MTSWLVGRCSVAEPRRQGFILVFVVGREWKWGAAQPWQLAILVTQSQSQALGHFSGLGCMLLEQDVSTVCIFLE